MAFSDEIEKAIKRYNFGNKNNGFNHVAFVLGYNPRGKKISDKNDVNKYFKKGDHAEVAVYKKFLIDLKYYKGKINNIDILVIRISKNGKLGNSKPCKNCTKYLYEKGVRKVFYSNFFGEIEEVKIFDLYHEQNCKETPSIYNFF